MSSLKEWRKQKGMSQQELGSAVFKKMGKRPNTAYVQKSISLWENYRSTPSRAEKTAICSVLEVSEDDIEFGTMDPASRTPPVDQNKFLAQTIERDDISTIQKLIDIFPNVTWNQAFQLLTKNKKVGAE
jgi:transcriptional regulator with XRE-family HTH domain